MRRVAAVLALLLAVPSASREKGGVQGDGKPTTQRRDVGAFDAIVLDTSADVTVRVGGAPSVSVTMDGNLQPPLRTDVRGGALVISSDRTLRAPKARVEVTVPALRRFELAG